MSDLSVITLYSGSKGNSIFVNAGNTCMLFDAGLTCSALCSSLKEINIAPEEIDAIFITHEHSDHISALNVFSKRYDVPIHITEPSAAGLKCDEKKLVIHDPLYSVSLNDCEISSFITPHDSHMSVGYVVRTDYGNVGIATDLGFVPDEITETLSYCDSVVLESNHDVEMLKRGPYPPALKRRILSKYGHLSNVCCAETAAYLVTCGVKNIMLAHISEHNNTPEFAYTETRRRLDSIGYSFVNLQVASAGRITKLI